MNTIKGETREEEGKMEGQREERKRRNKKGEDEVKMWGKKKEEKRERGKNKEDEDGVKWEFR